MSGPISSNFGNMQAVLRGIDTLNARNDILTAQTSTGVLSSSYAGLGDEADAAISLEPQITATNAWQTNLTQMQTKFSATQNALSGITAIATSLQNSLLSLQATSSPSTVALASNTARQQLTQLTSLLNTQSGDNYVFAGTASDQPPASSDLASSGMVSSIISAVVQVGTVGASATEAATLAAASDNSAAGSVFSAQLSVPATVASALVPQVQVGLNMTLASGIVATQGGAASGQSTGSPIRDLIRGLATVAGLSGAAASSAGLQSLLSDMSAQMPSLMQGLAGLTACVGTLQDTATSQSGSLSDINAALQGQLNAAKGSDPATTRTQQIAVQNQLTASYTLIADMKTLTLAQYI